MSEIHSINISILYDSNITHDWHIKRWLQKNIRDTSKRLFKTELPDKFKITYSFPRYIKASDSLCGYRKINHDLANDTKMIKSVFNRSDLLRFYGLNPGKHFYFNEKQTKTVSTKIKFDEGKGYITATYKTRPVRSIVKRDIISNYNIEQDMIISSSTELIYTGDLSDPDTKVKIEASIKSMNKNQSFQTRKYKIDLEKRKITGIKSKKPKEFCNQDEFFEKLISDMGIGHE